MEENNLNSNPIERYYARVWQLAERDLQLDALRPKPAVRETVRQPSMSHSDIIATVLDAYAERPALAERSYDVAVDASSGRMERSSARNGPPSSWNTPRVSPRASSS